MAEHTTVSMQDSTTGAITTFLEHESCECLPSIKLLSFFAGALHRYEEEGAVLKPTVLLCNSIARFCQSLPGGRFIMVGATDLNGEAGKGILKQCATLSRAGWTVFVERNQDGTRAKFGVLSFLESPTSVSLREMVTLGRDDSLEEPELAILAEQTDPRTVLFSGSRGNTLRISFSTIRVVENSQRAIESFCEQCCARADHEGFAPFFLSLIERSLNDSHGTILACRAGKTIENVKGMNDAVVLDPALDLYEAFINYKSSGSADSLLELQRSEALLIGMMQSDGIIVFDDRGSVTAYRVFFRPPERSKTRPGARTPAAHSANPAGGARRRAFEGLKALVGSELAGVLFRSQDGLTEFKGSERGE